MSRAAVPGSVIAIFALPANEQWRIPDCLGFDRRALDDAEKGARCGIALVMFAFLAAMGLPTRTLFLSRRRAAIVSDNAKMQDYFMHIGMTDEGSRDVASSRVGHRPACPNPIRPIPVSPTKFLEMHTWRGQDPAEDSC